MRERLPVKNFVFLFLAAIFGLAIVYVALPSLVKPPVDVHKSFFTLSNSTVSVTTTTDVTKGFNQQVRLDSQKDIVLVYFFSKGAAKTASEIIVQGAEKRVIKEDPIVAVITTPERDRFFQINAPNAKPDSCIPTIAVPWQDFSKYSERLSQVDFNLDLSPEKCKKLNIQLASLSSNPDAAIDVLIKEVGTSTPKPNIEKTPIPSEIPTSNPTEFPPAETKKYLITVYNYAPWGYLKILAGNNNFRLVDPLEKMNVFMYEENGQQVVKLMFNAETLYDSNGYLDASKSEFQKQYVLEMQNKLTGKTSNAIIKVEPVNKQMFYAAVESSNTPLLLVNSLPVSVRGQEKHSVQTYSSKIGTVDINNAECSVSTCTCERLHAAFNEHKKEFNQDVVLTHPNAEAIEYLNGRLKRVFLLTAGGFNGNDCIIEENKLEEGKRYVITLRFESDKIEQYWSNAPVQPKAFIQKHDEKNGNLVVTVKSSEPTSSLSVSLVQGSETNIAPIAKDATATLTLNHFDEKIGYSTTLYLEGKAIDEVTIAPLKQSIDGMLKDYYANGLRPNAADQLEQKTSEYVNQVKNAKEKQTRTSEVMALKQESWNRAVEYSRTIALNQYSTLIQQAKWINADYTALTNAKIELESVASIQNAGSSTNTHLKSLAKLLNAKSNGGVMDETKFASAANIIQAYSQIASASVKNVVATNFELSSCKNALEAYSFANAIAAQACGTSDPSKCDDKTISQRLESLKTVRNTFFEQEGACYQPKQKASAVWRFTKSFTLSTIESAAFTAGTVIVCGGAATLFAPLGVGCYTLAVGAGGYFIVNTDIELAQKAGEFGLDAEDYGSIAGMVLGGYGGAKTGKVIAPKIGAVPQNAFAYKTAKGKYEIAKTKEAVPESYKATAFEVHWSLNTLPLAEKLGVNTGLSTTTKPTFVQKQIRGFLDAKYALNTLKAMANSNLVELNMVLTQVKEWVKAVEERKATYDSSYAQAVTNYVTQVRQRIATYEKLGKDNPFTNEKFEAIRQEMEVALAKAKQVKPIENIPNPTGPVKSKITGIGAAHSTTYANAVQDTVALVEATNERIVALEAIVDDSVSPEVLNNYPDHKFFYEVRKQLESKGIKVVPAEPKYAWRIHQAIFDLNDKIYSPSFVENGRVNILAYVDYFEAMSKKSSSIAEKNQYLLAKDIILELRKYEYPDPYDLMYELEDAITFKRSLLMLEETQRQNAKVLVAGGQHIDDISVIGEGHIPKFTRTMGSNPRISVKNRDTYRKHEQLINKIDELAKQYFPN